MAGELETDALTSSRTAVPGAMRPGSLELGVTRRDSTVVGVVPVDREAHPLQSRVFEALSSRTVMILAVVATHLFLGALFYSLYEGWSFPNALYFTATIITTVGYGDVAPKRRFSRVFSCVYVTLSVCFVFTLISYLITQLIERNMKKLVQGVTEPSATNGRAVMHSGWTKNEKHDLIAATMLFVAVLLGSVWVFVCFDGMHTIDALYFVLITSSTIGLGDFTPTHEGVRLFAAVWMVVITVMLSWLIGRWVDVSAAASSRSAMAKILREPMTARMFDRMDFDKDGRLTRGEYIIATLVRAEKVSQHDIDVINAAFERRDVNGDGQLDMSELTYRPLVNIIEP
eukprot:CAMPEP_0185847086 /NCGR_PEP_ID=MMETSP1354-20130828/2495_1 /TAXON_ID=708628 /ORGANISM="Erythrolobus madagascarensis, Strain CCMP3276" /LENGTH=342 /DNA_ID=CAMNT_0028547335 /DNA_START=33 /DNA_END=1061 /DNA_ORIENTATION=+